MEFEGGRSGLLLLLAAADRVEILKNPGQDLRTDWIRPERRSEYRSYDV